MIVETGAGLCHIRRIRSAGPYQRLEKDMRKLFLVTILSVFVSMPLLALPDDGTSTSSGNARKSASSSLDDISRTWLSEIHGEQPDQETLRLQNPQPDSKSVDAGENTPEQAVQDRYRVDDAAPSFISVVLRFVGLMGVMILLFYFLARYLRRKSGLGDKDSDLIRVVTTVPVMPGKYLQVVDMAGKLLVLGVSDNSIQLVTEVQDATIADRIRVWDSARGSLVSGEGIMEQLGKLLGNRAPAFWNSEASTKNQPRFQDNLNEALGRSSSGNPTREATDTDLQELLRRQKNRLSNLREQTHE